MEKQQEWFSTWFDSPYYHILYKNRDVNEARIFIDNLITYLHPKPDARIMDLACGKGRHAIYLNQKGFDVTGLDLSEKSIAHAKKFENEHLHFFVHDMRQVFEKCCFDFILNLFTSFGYFDNDTENVVALNAAAENLKPGGKMVIDFMNTDKVIENLIAEEEKEIEGIVFNINRHVENGFIVKTIRFTDKGHNYCFEERVRALRQQDFLEFFNMSQLRLAEVFGDYQLGPYNKEESERMIFVLKK